MPLKYFIYFILVPITVAFIIGIYNYRYYNKPLKLFFLFVAYGTLNEYVVQYFIKILKSQNTIPFNHLYGIIAFIILALFFRETLDGFVRRKIINGIIMLYGIYYLLNSLVIQNIYIYPTYARAVGGIIMLVFSILYFARVMNEAKIRKLSSEPLIWINTALLIWYASSFFYFITFNVLLTYSREFLSLTVTYYGISNLILYTLASIGFIKSRRVYSVKRA